MDKKRIIDIAKLVVPSTAGVLLFLVPVSYGESQEMLSGIIVSWLKSSLEGVSVPLLVCMVSASAVLSLWHRISPIPFISRHDGLDAIFSPSRFWIAVRVGGAAMMLAVFLGIGPAELVSEGTGGNMLYTVAPTCAAWYLIGGVFLPLLTDYGFVDLFASLLRGVAQPLFRIPGRSVANCLSSWFGSSVCGTYLTISQYEKGFYTGREAATIISCFSILSISFCSMIASILGLGRHFIAFYGTIAITGLILALLLPRIWPIRSMTSDYCDDVGKKIDEEAPENVGRLAWGCRQALARAASAPGLGTALSRGLTSALNMTVSTLPSIMVFGTVALMVATYTDLFAYLGAPLGAYLSLFGIPDAMEVGSIVLVGFADQFVPVILGAAQASVEVRFLVGTLCILQVLYMTDIGALILTSKIPFSFPQLFVVYLERVLISVPMVLALGHLFGVL